MLARHACTRSLPSSVCYVLFFFFLFISLLPVFSDVRYYAIARPSVVRRLSATLLRATQAVQIFGNISTTLGTLTIL